MLPVHSFLVNSVEEKETVDDSATNIPFVRNMNAHIHQHNYFELKIKEDTCYLGQSIATSAKRDVPVG